jgi:hypothetical protein
MLNLIFALLVTLTSNVATSNFGNKSFVVFEHTYSGPTETTYQASYLVTYNTPTGVQVVGYVIPVPAGTSGFAIYPFRITAGWTVATWERTAWGPFEP